MKVPLTAFEDFSGVVLVSRGDETLLAEASGYAHIAYGIENTVDTRFAIASGTKGLTALVVVGLVPEGRLELATSAREVLGDDLPLIDGYPQRFPPGERFHYNNGAFSVLGLIAEGIAGIPFAELVRTRVTEPAGMADTSRRPASPRP
jgi:CubicO group peptidase (beta-lactamase class C family)